ncbi:hypothetical protein ACSTD9_22645, partial [Vibrio vulnificus]|uniref:hypothetical protein n=1 Tax=Vibrio vulnificus TaxID=672 RepID=UPI003ED86377
FFLLECDSKLTHYHPNWLNFNSDNYPARGGFLWLFSFEFVGKLASVGAIFRTLFLWRWKFREIPQSIFG